MDWNTTHIPSHVIVIINLCVEFGIIIIVFVNDAIARLIINKELFLSKYYQVSCFLRTPVYKGSI